MKIIGWGLHGLPEPVVARVLHTPIRLLWLRFVRDRFARQ
jgi:hypothetical protein